MTDPNHYDYVTTYSGRKLNFKKPDPDDILIEDIAHHLSMTCRYSGATKYHYSVGQHSVILAMYVYEQTNDPMQALSALLHDASEAYITDLPRPVKGSVTGYKSIENRLMKAIFKKFGVDKPSDFVMNADMNIVANEAMNVMKNVPDWVGDYEYLDISIDSFIESPQEDVKEAFLYVYNKLKNSLEIKNELS